MNQMYKPQILADFSVNLVYIAGASFILGSMATLLALLLLDFMQRNTEKRISNERRKGERLK